MITDYEIQQARTTSVLQEGIKLRIESGWEPQGGLYIEDGTYYQAMIQRSEKVEINPS